MRTANYGIGFVVFLPDIFHCSGGIVLRTELSLRLAFHGLFKHRIMQADETQLLYCIYTRGVACQSGRLAPGYYNLTAGRQVSPFQGFLFLLFHFPPLDRASP